MQQLGKNNMSAFLEDLVYPTSDEELRISPPRLLMEITCLGINSGKDDGASAKSENRSNNLLLPSLESPPSEMGRST